MVMELLESELLNMHELNQVSEQELSFKEVFYEDEIINEKEQAETLKHLVLNEEYESIQKKIKDLKQSTLPKEIKKIENRAKMLIFGGAIIPSLIILSCAILDSIADFETSMVFIFSMLASVFAGTLSGMHNLYSFDLKEEDFKRQKDKNIKDHYNQLVNSFFNGNVVENVENLNEKSWQKISVLENGRTETYMIRIKTDNTGLEHIESMKVVEDN